MVAMYIKSRTKRLCLFFLLLFLLFVLINILILVNGIWFKTFWNGTEEVIKHEMISFADGNLEDEENVLLFSSKIASKFFDEKIDEEHKHSLPPEYKVVHLDLKGAPPKLTYLSSILPVLAAVGANALLIEYEDTFPYEGNLRNISAKNCYTRSDIREINRMAVANNLEIIPLVQTFGHMEFVLKLEEFTELRERPDYPQEICPSNPKSIELIKNMLRQVRALHPNSRFMHIGCDEVFQIAVCPKCVKQFRKYEENNKVSSLLGRDSRFEIFSKHVSKIAKAVRDELGMIPIIWDDMLRQQGPRLIGSELTSLVEPMIWAYTEDITRLVPNFVWYAYAAVFPNVWVASAYKGTSGETAVVPNVSKHMANTEAWLNVVGGKVDTGSKIRRFRGVVLTGWSRYDHFAVLCELLPAAFPSLIINLAMLTSGSTTFDIKAQSIASKNLGCGNLNDIRIQRPLKYPLLSMESINIENLQLALANACQFPGSNLLASMRQYLDLRHDVNSLIQEVTERQGWLTKYNVRHEFSNPWRINEALVKQPFLLAGLEGYRNSTERILSQYFDKSTVIEWTEQRIEPLLSKMKDLRADAKMLMTRKTWPRRPLN